MIGCLGDMATPTDVGESDRITSHPQRLSHGIGSAASCSRCWKFRPNQIT